MQDDFLMQVSNIDSIKNKGIALSGTIISGDVKIGDTIYLQTDSAQRIKTKVLDIIKKNSFLSWKNIENKIILIVDVDKDIAQRCEYVLKTDDPAKIKNSQIYYDRNDDPYHSEYQKSETLIDGKPISEQNEDDVGPVTLFDKFLNKFKK